MKYKIILPVMLTTTLLVTSCYDQKMEWGRDPSQQEITEAQIPLDLEEKILRYDALRTYKLNPDMKVGVGIDLSQYENNAQYRTLVNENFDEVTVGYAMKHGAMVKNDGTIDFTGVDALIQEVEDNGLSVFGHTLCWQSNQNAVYLNSLIASQIITSAGSNMLTNGNFDSDISGWNSWGSGKSSVEYTTESSISGGALKAVSNSTASQLWSLEIQSENVTIVPGHRYEISFFIKSTSTGHARLAFNGMNQSYPWINGAETVETNSTWQQITYDSVSLGSSLMPLDTATYMNFRFDLGLDPDVTYYIDNVVMTDLDGVTETNLFTNSDFESGALTGWSGWGNSSTRSISAEGEGYNSNYSMVIDNPTEANSYSAQQVYDFDSPLEENTTYTCSFMIKATAACDIQIELQNPSDYSANYYGGISVGTNWTAVSLDVTPTTATRSRFVFDLGANAVTYYIDDIKLVTADGSSSSGETVVIEKSDSAKAAIIKAALEDWISQMVTHYKDKVHAWDVVNEPMEENGSVRTDYVSTSSDIFPWMKYLGKDYAVYAFKFAREYGNASDKLFINDYNLESNLTKCQGLIDYVTYIEQQGGTVDGIGTQMHVSINTDTTGITQMFELLAQTGKLIKVSELDVQIGTSSPTTEQLIEQENMYEFILNAYHTIIPESQQYGITIWGVSDNADEHEYWLPDDVPNLWNADYARKPAYKGACDGLAGRDVSEDFTGELIY